MTLTSSSPTPSSLTSSPARFRLGHAATLARFPLRSRDSRRVCVGPAPGYEVVDTHETRTSLDEQPVAAGREPGETDAGPGRVRGCDDPKPAGSRPSEVAGSHTSDDCVGRHDRGGEGAAYSSSISARSSWRSRFGTTPPAARDQRAPGWRRPPGNLDCEARRRSSRSGRIATTATQPTRLTARVEDLPPSAGCWVRTSVAYRAPSPRPSTEPRSDELRRLRRLVRAVAPRRLARSREQLLGQLAEEVVAGDDRVDAPVGRDRDDEHAVVQEELGQLRVGVLVFDDDVVGRQVLADRLVRAARGGRSPRRSTARSSPRSRARRRSRETARS